MTSYFRPDIKGDAVRKEMVLSRCTVTFFFFEQKVSFQTLTKVRCHLILKGGCLKTSEAPVLYPSPATLAFLSLPPSSSHLRHPQNTHSFLPSCLHGFSKLLWGPSESGESAAWNQARHSYFLERRPNSFAFCVPQKASSHKFQAIIFVWAGNQIGEGRERKTNSSEGPWLMVPDSFASKPNEKQDDTEVVTDGRSTRFGQRERKPCWDLGATASPTSATAFMGEDAKSNPATLEAFWTIYMLVKSKQKEGN